MAVHITYNMVVKVFDYDGHWKAFDFLERLDWNLPEDCLLTGRALQPLQAFSHQDHLYLERVGRL